MDQWKSHQTQLQFRASSSFARQHNGPTDEPTSIKEPGDDRQCKWKFNGITSRNIEIMNVIANTLSVEYIYA